MGPSQRSKAPRAGAVERAPPVCLWVPFGILGGEAGIRTLGTHKGTTVFETAPIDRSGTSPTERCPGLSRVGQGTKAEFGTQSASEGSSRAHKSNPHGAQS